jgi:hypothetical protein
MPEQPAMLIFWWIWNLGRSLFDLSGLLLDLEALLHVSIDVVTERGLRDRVRGQVMREVFRCERTVDSSPALPAFSYRFDTLRFRAVG